MNEFEAIETAAQLLGDVARRDVALGDFTTYRVGGTAALFVEATDDDALATVSAAVRATRIPVLVIGRGSNLLVADSGFGGIALVLGEHFASVDLSDTTVVAGGAAKLPVVARRAAAAGLAGFEWAVGVPGSIGGAVSMNAGGHGSDMAECLQRVRVLDVANGDNAWVSAVDLDLSYRHSNLTNSQVVLCAELKLQRGDQVKSEAMIAEIVRWRRANQPGGSNAGSVFTNPVGDSAGRLLDAAGCKGFRVGSAEVSSKHANFIQTDEGGRAADVIELMRQVQARVESDSGVRLRCETRLVGFDDARIDSLSGTNPKSVIEGL